MVSSVSDEKQYDSVMFSAADGYQLTGRVYATSANPKAVLLVNSGTGIPQGFYKHFAHYAANDGFVVITFDYRGIGDSAPESLAGFEANYRDWGQLDVTAAISWVKATYPMLPITVIGHSTGGQQLGLASNVSEVSAAVFVSVSTGYWKGMFTNSKWLSLWLWTCYVPVATRLRGFAPTKFVGLGENLPSGVAREWGSWCLQPDYLAAYFDDTGHKASKNGKAFGPVQFHNITFPINAYCFTDDHIATRENVPSLMKLFTASDVTTQWVSPAQYQAKTIGHFGFFRANIGKQMWQEALDWLTTQITHSKCA